LSDIEPAIKQSHWLISVKKKGYATATVYDIKVNFNTGMVLLLAKSQP